MHEILVLQHTEAAGPSAFAEVLDARAPTIAPWRLVDVTAGEPLPAALDELAGLVVLGGTMSATDPTAHPWMPVELDLLRAAVDAEVPVLGVCLGAQLLGQALAGEVRRRDVPEIALLPLERTEAGRDDPVTAGWPDGARALFVHEDEVTTLPPGATPLLDGSDGVPAWRLGNALAIQFHPEVTADQLEGWLTSGMLDRLFAATDVDPEDFARQAARHDRFTVPLGRALLGRFLDGPVRERVS